MLSPGLLLAAALAVPPVVAHMRDGRTIEVARPVQSSKYIVEFQDPPLITRRRFGLGGQSHQLDRFRADLAHDRANDRAIRREYFRAFHGASVTLDAAGLEAVRRLSYVKAVYDDTPVKMFASEDANRIARLGVDRVWSQLHARGEGIVVAVIDTGVDYNHPALGGGFGPAFKVIGGIDYVDGDDDPMDEHGHGTHVAGIIAGTTSDVPGVAPAAKLFAIRVLDEHGEGSTGDVLMGIERAVDPNLDGDLSDHADVANMSLGGDGNANSPLSLAVDRAVEAGVVFCVAAGNTPGEMTIGSPAGSRLAITVGNSDADDALNFTSSRGPSAPDWTLKPEVVAPGTLIRSAKLGGGTLLASGTSMAAPHVAGAAALLLELHPQWTPADVKSAVAGTAQPIVEEVMGQGGGRIDVFSAATASSAVVPGVVSFDRHGGSDGWTSTRTVRIVNRAATAQTFTASFVTPDGVTVAADPATFALEPAASRDIVLTATITAAAGQALETFSHGGRVTFTSPQAAVHVPWIAVDAALVVITSERPSTMFWGCDHGPGMSIAGAASRHDLLIPNSRCDLVAFSDAPDGGVLLLGQSRTIDDDAQIAYTTADAKNTVALAGTDQNGALVNRDPSAIGAPYVSGYDLEFPPASKFHRLSISTLAALPLHVSDLDDDFTITSSEVWFDFPHRSVYAIHHRPLHGVHASTTLTTLPWDLRHVHAHIEPQREGTMLNAVVGYMADGAVVLGPMGSFVPLESGWDGDVYVTEEPNPNAWLGVSLLTSRDGDGVWTDVVNHVFRADGDRVVLSSDLVPSPASYGVKVGGTLMLGAPPLRPTSLVDTAGNFFAVFLGLAGPANELAADATTGFAWTLRDGAGQLLREGTATGTTFVSADFGSRGVYQTDVRFRSGEQLMLRFDTSLPDWNPPSLTSLRITAPDGTLVRRVAPHGSATLAFSVGDYTRDANGTVRDTGDLRMVRASWRTYAGAWQELPLTNALEDRGDPAILGHLESGVHYRADLAPIAASATGKVDLRFELADASGNTSTSILEGAIVVSERRRSSR